MHCFIAQHSSFEVQLDPTWGCAVQGYYVLPSKRQSANSNGAGEMVTTTLPTEPKHEPVHVAIPAVSLRSSGFRGALHAVLAALTEVQHFL